MMTSRLLQAEAELQGCAEWMRGQRLDSLGAGHLENVEKSASLFAEIRGQAVRPPAGPPAQDTADAVPR